MSNGERLLPGVTRAIKSGDLKVPSYDPPPTSPRVDLGSIREQHGLEVLHALQLAELEFAPEYNWTLKEPNGNGNGNGRSSNGKPQEVASIPPFPGQTATRDQKSKWYETVLQKCYKVDHPRANPWFHTAVRDPQFSGVLLVADPHRVTTYIREQVPAQVCTDDGLKATAFQHRLERQARQKQEELEAAASLREKRKTMMQKTPPHLLWIADQEHAPYASVMEKDAPDQLPIVLLDPAELTGDQPTWPLVLFRIQQPDGTFISALSKIQSVEGQVIVISKPQEIHAPFPVYGENGKTYLRVRKDIDSVGIQASFPLRVDTPEKYTLPRRCVIVRNADYYPLSQMPALNAGELPIRVENAIF